MEIKLLALLAIVLTLFLGSPGPTTAVHGTFASDETGTGYDWPAIKCGTPCIISDDGGGIIDTYEAQARLMAAGHTQVIVDGPCLSACTRFIDIDRANVCLTPRALLGYHQWLFKPEDAAPQTGDMLFDTPGLNEYLKSRGGQPAPDSGHLLLLNYLEASRFYKVCPT